MLSTNLAVEKKAGHDTKQSLGHKLFAALIIIAGALFVILR